MKEIWKDIPWYEWLYKVSNLWSINSYINWNLKISIFKNWYWYVTLYKNKINKKFRIHRLVWQAFLWLNIGNKKILVCHKDDNRMHNNKNNLFLWTYKDNAIDCRNKNRTTMLWKFWKEHHSSKPVKQLNKEWKLIKIWDCIKEAQDYLWIQHVSETCKWKNKTAWGYKWEYINI